MNELIKTKIRVVYTIGKRSRRPVFVVPVTTSNGQSWKTFLDERNDQEYVLCQILPVSPQRLEWIARRNLRTREV